MPLPPNRDDIARQKILELNKYSSLLSVLNNKSVNSRDISPVIPGPMPTPTRLPSPSVTPTQTITQTFTPSVTPSQTVTPSQIPCGNIFNINLSNFGAYDYEQQTLSALATFNNDLDICNYINVSLDFGGGIIVPIDQVSCNSPVQLNQIPFAGTLVFNTFCSTGLFSDGSSFVYDFSPTPQVIQLSATSLPGDSVQSSYSMFFTLCGVQSLTAGEIFNNYLYINQDVNQSILGINCLLLSVSGESGASTLYRGSSNNGYSCNFAASGLNILAQFPSFNTVSPGINQFANRLLSIERYYLTPSPSPTPTPTVTSYLTPTPTPSITPTPTMTRAAISTIDLTSTNNVTLSGLKAYDINNFTYNLYYYNLSTFNGTYSASYDNVNGQYTLTNVINDKHILYYDIEYGNCWTLVYILPTGLYFTIAVFNNFYDLTKLPLSGWSNSGTNPVYSGVDFVPYFALSGLLITKIN